MPLSIFILSSKGNRPLLKDSVYRASTPPFSPSSTSTTPLRIPTHSLIWAYYSDRTHPSVPKAASHRTREQASSWRQESAASTRSPVFHRQVRSNHARKVLALTPPGSTESIFTFTSILARQVAALNWEENIKTACLAHVIPQFLTCCWPKKD